MELTQPELSLPKGGTDKGGKSVITTSFSLRSTIDN